MRDSPGKGNKNMGSVTISWTTAGNSEEKGNGTNYIGSESEDELLIRKRRGEGERAPM